MRSDRDRLVDAHDHARHALGLMGSGADDLARLDRDRFQSLLFDVAVIGTTIGKISGEVLGLAPHVPWGDVVATRNRVVHAYWQNDAATWSDVVSTDDVRQLVAGLAILIAALEAAGP